MARRKVRIVDDGFRDFLAQGLEAWADFVKNGDHYYEDEEEETEDDLPYNEDDLEVEPEVYLSGHDVALASLIELQTRVEILHSFYDEKHNSDKEYDKSIDIETIGKLFGWDKKGETA